jgi:hypothetical protein
LPGGLRLLDIAAPCATLAGGWFAALRDVASILGFEAIPLLVNRCRTQLGNQFSRLGAIGDEFAVLNVRILFADQPGHRRPSPTRAFTGYPLDMSFPAHVLG